MISDSETAENGVVQFLKRRYELFVLAYLVLYILSNLTKTPFWKFLFD